MKFREHRGSLADSMKTVVEVRNKEELVEHIRKLFSPYVGDFQFDKIKVEPYGPPYTPVVYDQRIGWHTYLVTMPEYGVIGWTDGPADDPPCDHGNATWGPVSTCKHGLDK
jgi:hypothetical protein